MLVKLSLKAEQSVDGYRASKELATSADVVFF